MAGKYHVRSISLPATSHPTSVRVEQELNSLKMHHASSSDSATVICSGLSGLEKLYNCVDELLAMHTTEESLLTHQSEQWAGDLFDASVKILDVCCTSRDTVLEVKRHVQEIQSAIRRRKGDSGVERSISSYKSFRKSLKRDATKMIAALKKTDIKIRASAVTSADIDRLRIIRVLTEATTITISIFESLLMIFLGTSLSCTTTTKWSFVPRLMNKRVAACDKEILNEFLNADAALVKSASSEVSSDALDKLATLEMSLGGLEDCLENVFRCLLRSRVCMLNIMSH
ncbi:hypothetical protein QQ045_027735 [Rhodiola kirilowii]